MKPLDKETLQWVIELIEKQILNVKDDFDRDSKELALRRVLDEVRQKVK